MRVDSQLPVLRISATWAAMAIADKELEEQLVALKDSPGHSEESYAAKRALVRYGKCDDEISASEDWVRLFIALRRTAGPAVRITPAILKQWKPKVSSVTTLKRKCYLVDRLALDALPAYPPDLDKWVIPKDELVLPADIYSDGMLIIDDGYDRLKLNVPGVLHIECGARWKMERKTVDPRPASSSGLDCAAPASPPDGRTSGFSRAATDLQTAVALQAAPSPTSFLLPSTEASQELPGDSHDDAMPDIIANTKKCLATNRWVSHDPSQPDTVEFWLRIFQVQMNKKDTVQWTDLQRCFVKYVTKECFGCSDGDALPAIIPLLRKLNDKTPEHLPALAKALISLHEVDFSAAPAASNSESKMHESLQADLNINSLQYLYSSPCYAGFLQRRFASVLRDARAAPDPQRGEAIRLLLASSKPGSEAHASLTFAQTLLDASQTDAEKIQFLWVTPHPRDRLTEWSLEQKWGVYLCFRQQAQPGDWAHVPAKDFVEALEKMRVSGVPAKEVPNTGLQPLYAEYTTLCDVESKFLRRCFEEQVMWRVLRTRAADPSASAPEDADVSPEDADVWATARALHKAWTSANGKKHNLVLLTALGQKLHAEREVRAKAKQEEEEAEARQEPEAEEPMEAKAEAEAEAKEEAKEKEANAEATEKEPREAKGQGKAARDLKVGDKVLTHAAKNKAKYDQRRAEVTGFLTNTVKVTMLDGPAKGEKRKLAYDAVTPVSTASVARALANSSAEPAAPAALAVEASTAAAPAASASTNTATAAQSADAFCQAMFGDLAPFS